MSSVWTPLATGMCFSGGVGLYPRVLSQADLVLGTLLPARLPESAGSITNVSTQAALTSALASVSNGSIINITASINGGGSVLEFDRTASASAPITITSSPGVVLSNFQVIIPNGDYLRLRGLEVSSNTIDGIKVCSNGGKVGSHIEIDGCHVHDCTRQGLSVQDNPSYVQFWNNKVHDNGSNTNQDHGLYFAHVNGDCVVANNLFYDNQGYNIQAYPNATNLIITCNTLDGGVTRGGMVVGSETGVTDNTITVGLVSTYAPWYSIDLYDPAGGDTGNNAYDCIAFGSTLGSYRSGSSMTYTNCITSDPLYVNRAGKDYRLQSSSPAISAIQPARYGYVPPRDILGNLRMTADAGCYAKEA